jgi:C_GCAxxG_C_C family probable redox protein
MTTGDIAVNKFNDGFNCSQSVIFSFADALGIDKETALKISTGFGGGMGRKQDVCGAISGAILVLSSAYGRGENDGVEKKDDTYQKVRELIDAFRKERGAIDCRELLSGCDLLSEAGQQTFKENNLASVCCRCIQTSCAILEELMREDDHGKRSCKDE